jgi:hypothetical protein
MHFSERLGTTRSRAAIAVAVCLALLSLPAAGAMAHTRDQGPGDDPPGTGVRELPEEDPARGLTYDELEPGPEDGPCQGLLEVRSEEGELESCTHGPDPAPKGIDVRKERSTKELLADAEKAEAPADPAVDGEPRPGDRPPPPPIPCIEDNDFERGQGGNRVHAIYAYPADLKGGSRYAAVLPLIRRYAAEADRVFYESARKTSGTRHVRFITDNDCRLVVTEVQLNSRGDNSFLRTIGQLRGRGFNRTDRKYLVWMDSNRDCVDPAFAGSDPKCPKRKSADICGLGNLERDDRPTSDNRNNGSGSPTAPAGMFARIDAACWGGYVEAHELMHNLGGVQSSAPNATPAPVGPYAGGHCTDESDLMCYDDDGLEDGEIKIDIGCGPADVWCVKVRRPIRQVCNASQELFFDCNDDDYFNTSPPSGSYLDKRWNTADSSFLSNRYFDRDAPEVTPPVHDLTDPLAPTTLPYSLTWSARDPSGVREFRLWQYKESLTSPGAWSEFVIPSGAGVTPNWIIRNINLPLTPGHGYKYAVRAVDFAGNTSNWVYGQYFWVDGYDETNSPPGYAVNYTGTWSAPTFSGNHFEGATRRTNVAGSEASLTHSGSYVAWIGTLDPSGGNADVYLDGTKVKTVSLNAASSHRRILFSKRYQCPPGQCGSHTITIRATGGGYVDLDAFVVEENGS